MRSDITASDRTNRNVFTEMLPFFLFLFLFSFFTLLLSLSFISKDFEIRAIIVNNLSRDRKVDA